VVTFAGGVVAVGPIYKHSGRRRPVSLHSERLLNHMLRLRLTHLTNCFEVIAE